MKKNKKKFNIFPLLIVLATIFMSVGYATVNSVILDINGSSVAIIADKIFISYATASGSGVVSGYYDTMLTSSIALSSTDKNSTETIQVNIFNNSGKTLFFSGTSYNSEIPGGYTNSNIDFTLSGIDIGEELSQGEDITFNVTFKYTDSYKAGSAPYNGNLSSIINFDFVETMEGMVTVTYTGESVSGLETTAFTGNPFDVDLSGKNLYVTGVVMDGSPASYTYENEILRIANVTGDIVISLESVENIEYIIDADNTEYVKTISVNDSLTNFLSSGGFNAKAPSNIVKSLTISFPYSNSGKDYSVNCILKADGNEVATKSFTFAKGARNQTITITFTDVNIPAGQEITISFENSGSGAGQGNQKVSVDAETIDFVLDES